MTTSSEVNGADPGHGSREELVEAIRVRGLAEVPCAWAWDPAPRRGHVKPLQATGCSTRAQDSPILAHDAAPLLCAHVFWARDDGQCIELLILPIPGGVQWRWHERTDRAREVCNSERDGVALQMHRDRSWLVPLPGTSKS